jgi:CRP/FNR family transcriptional regulator, cyclic AMP receptor protein
MTTQESPASRTRGFEDSPALAQQAADLLRAPRTNFPLSTEDAVRVVNYMRLVNFPRGSVLFREGDDSRSNYMLLLLEGEVAVDTSHGNSADPSVPISVIGPGSVIGEMALIDGAPRSASCTAVSSVVAAGMSRQGLELLLNEHPAVAARLLIVLAQFTAERLRAMSDQLQLYAKINDQLRARSGG